MDDNEDVPEEDTVKSDDEDAPTSPRTSQSKPANNKQSKQSKVKRRTNPVLPASLIQTAMDIVHNYLDELSHEFIDRSLDVPELMTEKQWEEFIRQYYQLIL